LTPAALRGILRDHYDAGTVHRPRPFDDPRFFSLCMHADPLDNTTAAMVARLPRDPGAVATVWVCLGSPCVGAFLPCYLEGTVPDVLAREAAGIETGRTPSGTVLTDFMRCAVEKFLAEADALVREIGAAT